MHGKKLSASLLNSISSCMSTSPPVCCRLMPLIRNHATSTAVQKSTVTSNRAHAYQLITPALENAFQSRNYSCIQNYLKGLYPFDSKLRVNPLRRSSSLSGGVQTLYYYLSQATKASIPGSVDDHDQQNMHISSTLSSLDPRWEWMYSYAELLETTEMHQMSVQQAKKWLLQCDKVPDHLRDGLRTGQYEIDHILPRCKGGQDHPINYYIMERPANRRFNAFCNMDKCHHVGLLVSWRVLLFHWAQLPFDTTQPSMV